MRHKDLFSPACSHEFIVLDRPPNKADYLEGCQVEGCCRECGFKFTSHCSDDGDEHEDPPIGSYIADSEHGNTFRRYTYT